MEISFPSFIGFFKCSRIFKNKFLKELFVNEIHVHFIQPSLFMSDVTDIIYQFFQVFSQKSIFSSYHCIKYCFKRRVSLVFEYLC